MNTVDNRTTRKDNKKYQTTNLIYDQNSMAIINKIRKSNSHQIKPKQNNLTYTLLEKVGDLFSMRLINRSTKKSKEVRSLKIRFHF